MAAAVSPTKSPSPARAGGKGEQTWDPVPEAEEDGQPKEIDRRGLVGFVRGIVVDTREWTKEFMSENAYGPPYIATDEENADFLDECSKPTPNLLSIHEYLASGCDPNFTSIARNDDHGAALHYCARHGHTLLCRMLLRAKANVDQATGSGRTALMLCASRAFGDTSVAHLVLKAHAEPNLRDRGGNTALLYAVNSRNVGMTRLLLKFDAQVERPLQLLHLNAASELKQSRNQWKELYEGDFYVDRDQAVSEMGAGGCCLAAVQCVTRTLGITERNKDEQIFDLMIGAAVRQERIKKAKQAWWDWRRKNERKSRKKAAKYTAPLTKEEKRALRAQEKGRVAWETMRDSAHAEVESKERDADMRAAAREKVEEDRWHKNKKTGLWEVHVPKRLYPRGVSLKGRKKQKMDLGSPQKTKVVDIHKEIQSARGDLTARETSRDKRQKEKESRYDFNF